METRKLPTLEEIVRQIAREEIVLDRLRQKSNFDSTNELNSPIVLIGHKSPTGIGWLKGYNSLQKLHELLIACTFLSCKLDEFTIHFLGKATDFLKWETNLNKLAYLFYCLESRQCIPKSTKRNKLVSEHFLDQNGNKLKPEILRSLLEDSKNNSTMQTIVNIVDAVGKIVG